MKEEKLKSGLDSLWGSKINTLEVDLCSHFIFLEVTVTTRGGVAKHSVVFEEVASFYFSANSGERRFFPAPWDYIELTGIEHSNEPLTFFSYHRQDEFDPEYQMKPNFAVEMWAAILFIEAARVTIDGVAFEVGYPGR